MAFFHCLFVSFAAFALGKLSPGEEPLPAMADSGKKEFDAIAGATANSESRPVHVRVALAQ